MTASTADEGQPLRSRSTTSDLRRTSSPRSTRPSSTSTTATSSKGAIVKVDRDEVLLDIGYKTEGVIPSRELSIKHDVDPVRGRQGRRRGRGPRPPEGGQGRPADPVQEARSVRARLGHDREDQGRGRRRHRHRHRGRQGWPHPRHRPARLPARLARRDAPRPRPPAVRRQGDRGQDHRAGQEPQQRGPVPPCLARADPVRGPHRRSSTSCRRARSATASSPRIVNFGAFVDLGGVDGLVHVSELSWKHIDHPSEVVEVGQEVTVEVLDVDMDRERVSLSLKATQEDPWQHFARTHPIGQVVPGKVTKLVPFGAFVRVDEGIEGLVHISELAERHVEMPEQVVDGRRRHLRQGHRHRPRASPHLAVAQAGQREQRRRSPSSTPPLRHGCRVRRGRQLQVPRGLRPRDRRVARGLRGRSARSGRSSTPRRTPAGRRTTQQVEEAAKADAEAAANPEAATSYSSGGGSGSRLGFELRLQLVLHLRFHGLRFLAGRRHAGVRRGPGCSSREAHRRLITTCMT